VDTASFAAQLRQHRLALGLTQAELAERAGLSERGISDLERGLKQAPRASTVRLLVGGLARLVSPDAGSANQQDGSLCGADQRIGGAPE
jgi:transcriptional regulator with XRE-family HTH domain